MKKSVITVLLLGISLAFLPTCQGFNKQKSESIKESTETESIIEYEYREERNDLIDPYSYTYENLMEYDSIVVGMGLFADFVNQPGVEPLAQEQATPYFPELFVFPPTLNEEKSDFYHVALIRFPGRYYYSRLFAGHDYTTNMQTIWLVNYSTEDDVYIDSRRILNCPDDGVPIGDHPVGLNSMYSVYFPEKNQINTFVYIPILEDYNKIQRIIHPDGLFEDHPEEPYSTDSITVGAFDVMAITGKFPSGEKWLGFNFNDEEYAGYGARIGFYETVAGHTDISYITTLLKQTGGDDITDYPYVELAFRGDFTNTPVELVKPYEEYKNDYPGLQEKVTDYNDALSVGQLTSFYLEGEKYMFAYVHQADEEYTPYCFRSLVGIPPDGIPIELERPQVQKVYVFRLGERNYLFTLSYAPYFSYQIFELDNGFKKIDSWYLVGD